MRAKLNIGLQWSERFGHGAGQWHPNHVIAELQDEGFEVLEWHEAKSWTEPTVVVDLWGVQTANYVVANVVHGWGLEAVLRVAEALWQDAVAVRVEGEEGVLVGPFAREWGTFREEWFLE